MQVLLSISAGFVDTAGFLGLHGLFAAHVTGNFVTLGAALVLGTSGVLAKLLALPVFCGVVLGVHLLRYQLTRLELSAFRILLVFKLLLLTMAAVLAIYFGPFRDGNSGSALAVGMALVAAMAVQNALQRVYLGSAPPTTMVTGTTTQFMLDLADRLCSRDPALKAAINARLVRMASRIGAFALGCATGALLYACIGYWCFVMPPLMTLGAYLRYEVVDNNELFQEIGRE